MNKKHFLPLFLSLILLFTAAVSFQNAKADGQIDQFEATASSPQVNVPYFSNDVEYEEMAVFWFGQVRDKNSYADIRIGYNSDHLRINIAVFDRYLWYDADPGTDLDNHDAITILLDPNHSGGSSPKSNDVKILTQFTWYESDRGDWELTAVGNGSQWTAADVDITTTSGWRGSGPNDNDGNDRGWVVNITVPFSSLGLNKPTNGSVWGLGAILHDRDSAEPASMSPSYTWPAGVDLNQPSTWGNIVFNPAPVNTSGTVSGTTKIRQGLNGVSVTDGHVGGNTMCGQGIDFWTEWGDKNYAGDDIFNVQNQSDVADFPCFSKFYVKFPTKPVPKGKSIVSAKLVLHQFGGSDPSQADPSLIQVFQVSNDWNENNLTWNNSPLVIENLSTTWVNPLQNFPDWPGIRHEWDVTSAVVQAYQNASDLSLALYSADGAYHSGKYFVTSDTEDWNRKGRPTLIVEWSETAPDKVELISPTEKITDVRPNFTWQNDPLATEYRLYISRAVLGVIHNQWHPTEEVCSSGTCSKKIDEHLFTGNHQWIIQTRNSYGGVWSDPKRFKLIHSTPPPSQPVLISPHGTGSTTPTFIWEPVETATWYKIFSSNNTVGKIYNTYHKALNVCYAEQCSIPPDVHGLVLSPERHFWWVRAVNTGGNGPWSDRADFIASP